MGKELILAFLRKLLHPEDFGWAVSKEVREEAKYLLLKLEQLL